MDRIYVGSSAPNHTTDGYWVDTTSADRVVKRYHNGAWNTAVDADTQKKVLRYVDSEKYKKTLAGNGILDAYDKAGADAYFVNEGDIADDLTTDNAKKVLSAKQGKVLKDQLDEVASRTQLIASAEAPTETTAVWLDLTDSVLKMYDTEGEVWVQVVPAVSE